MAVRLWRPEKDERFETPLDDLGRVDLDQLVALVKSTVYGDYKWDSPFVDIHHLQWPATRYLLHQNDIAAEFRELIRRKTVVPRLFHNWTHEVTLPPPVPPLEVMKHSIDAHQAAMKLASTARLAVCLTRLEEMPPSKLSSRLEEELENYLLYTEQAREVPPEFQLLQLDDVEAASVEDLIAVNKHFGRIALQHIPLRVRDVTLGPAA
jgi:hypothetical protein